MVDHCPFLLETLMQVENNTFFFQQHLKATCGLLSSSTWVCFLHFEQFIRQQMVHFQDFILECSHHHTFFNMFFDKILEAHCARILSCFGPRAGAWFNLTNIPNLSIIFPNFFHSALDAVVTTTSFDCRPPLLCVHTSHQSNGYPPLMLHSW